jgi:hypothetical protein
MACLGIWYGATWPRHGLPHGTLLLDVLLLGKIFFLESTGIEPWTSLSVETSRRPGYQPAYLVVLNTIWHRLNLNLHGDLFGGGKGRGLAPTLGLNSPYDHVMCPFLCIGTQL